MDTLKSIMVGLIIMALAVLPFIVLYLLFGSIGLIVAGCSLLIGGSFLPVAFLIGEEIRMVRRNR